MRKLYLILITVLIAAALSVTASAETLGEGSRRVFDYANLMSESERTELESLISGLRSKHNMDFVVLTSYDAETGKSVAYADDFYDYNGFGTGAEWDGFLFFIDMNNRVPTISTTGLMIRYVTDARLNDLFNTSYIYLDEGDFAKAAIMTLSKLDGFIQKGIPSDQYNIDEYGNKDYYYDNVPAVRSLSGTEFLIALGTGLVCALILFASVKYKYGLKGSTYRYNLNSNSDVNITGATDVYLRTNVVKVRKQSSSSGGGRGSSTRTSSSGRTHGGGSGRRF